jgi:BioD-like phosphotransacetylase family protein
MQPAPDPTRLFAFLRRRIEELLEMLEDQDSAESPPPLVVTSQDRTDIVLGLLAAQVQMLPWGIKPLHAAP